MGNEWNPIRATLEYGILKQAAQDYVYAKRKLMKHPDCKKAEETVEEVIDFIYSDWYSQLTDIDPNVFLALCDKRVKGNRYRRRKKNA